MAGRYSHNPGMEHWNALLQMIAYLERTLRYVLTLGGLLDQNLQLFAHADSDWAGNEERNSRSGVHTITTRTTLAINSSRKKYRGSRHYEMKQYFEYHCNSVLIDAKVIPYNGPWSLCVFRNITN
jgi:hypothetical protein